MSSKSSPRGLVLFLAIIVVVVLAGLYLVVDRMNKIVTEQIQIADVAVPTAGNFQLGDKIPDFTVETEAGEKVSLSDFQDGEHFVVVNVTHPDCPCAESCSKLINEMESEGYDDVKVMGVLPVDEDNPRVVKALHKQEEDGIVTFPVYFDPERVAVKMLGAVQTPTVWVLDKEGRIRFWGAPENTLFAGSEGHRYLLREAIDALRKGEDPPVKTFKPIGCAIEGAEEIARTSSS